MAKKTDLTKVKAKLVIFKDLINRSGYEDAKVYLFGSWAKGTTHDWSDIDVCVVSKKIENGYDARIVFRKMASMIDEDISPIAMKLEDFENKYYTLASEVKKHGIQI
jgi:predicted nucleotidyltransferase